MPTLTLNHLKSLRMHNPAAESWRNELVNKANGDDTDDEHYLRQGVQAPSRPKEERKPNTGALRIRIGLFLGGGGIIIV